MERISLSNAAFEGNNNVYLFDGGPETALVDTGDGTADTREQLRAGLAEHGVAFGDLDRIVLTHWHHDHVGLAGPIQAESGATVHVHAADAGLVAGEATAWRELQSELEDRLEAWGLPAEKRAAVRAAMGGPDQFETFPAVEPFRDGETIAAGARELRAVHVSGHAAGLCLFELQRGGSPESLSGDALLPVYTPNVGGADVRVERPLERYLDGLEYVSGAGYSRAWPGHREPIDDPAGRADEIVAHHERRAWRVLDAVRRLGPCDAWTVSDDLFGDLEGIHVLHGPGEAFAHLDHLQRSGAVARAGTEYRLADGTPERLASLTEERWSLRK